MIVNVYSIFDNKSKIFSQPWVAINDAVAIRSFSGFANDPGSQICRNAEDFSLHRLCTFDDNLGTFNDESGIENLGLAAAFREVQA